MAKKSSKTDDGNDRLVIDLPRPVEASHECLPHAAMSLGGPANVPRMVSRVVIERVGPFWTLYRLDDSGGFVGDSTHVSREDALHQVAREFGVNEAGEVQP